MGATARAVTGGVVWVAVCSTVLALALITLTNEGFRGPRQVELNGIDAEQEHAQLDLNQDTKGLSSLEHEVNGEVQQNNKLTQEYHNTFKDGGAAAPAPCTGLACVPSEKYLDSVGATWQPSNEPECCGEDAPPPQAQEVGDMSISAVIKGLQHKFHLMKQKFREIRANYYHGAPRTMDINIKPRGPAGFTGPPGTPGGPGDMGLPGAIGPVGPKGYRGYTGPEGDRGRRGAKGMTGVIGKPGILGAEGPRGPRGKKGIAGRIGARGLPGAAGVMGPNGKDGPPGPPGQNSVPGAPGAPGPPGPQGAQGKKGKDGARGPRGRPGQKGNAGNAGRPGAPGRNGANGVGPPAGAALFKAGRGTWGREYLRSRTCTKLGVKENLAGLCEPLCPECDATAGFKLRNPAGLRFKDLTFDDQNRAAGENQPINLCILAKYGNRGKVTKVPSSESFMRAVTNSKVKDEQHYYGNCAKDSAKYKDCCINSKVFTSGFDITKFATGDSCYTNDDKDVPAGEIYCYYDYKAYEEQSAPPSPPRVPRDRLTRNQYLLSGGSSYQHSLMSKNAGYKLKLFSNGKLKLYKSGKKIWSKGGGKGPAPYKAIMQNDGNFVIYDKNGRAWWHTHTWGGNAMSYVVMQNDGNFVGYNWHNHWKFQSNTPQRSSPLVNIKVKSNKSLCVGSRNCVGKGLLQQMKRMGTQGRILSGTASRHWGCRRGRRFGWSTYYKTITFKKRFARTPQMAVSISGVKGCGRNKRNKFRVRAVSVRKNRFRIKFQVYGRTYRGLKVTWFANSQPLKPHSRFIKTGKGSGDTQKARICMNGKCANSKLWSRMIQMADSHIEVGRRWKYLDRNCRWRRDHHGSVRVRFRKTFLKSPRVVVTSSKLDWCFQRRTDIRYYAYPSSISDKGFRLHFRTWANTRIRGLEYTYFAFSRSLVQNRADDFPQIPSVTDALSEKFCIGNECVGNREWGKMLDMGKWRIETGHRHWHWGCRSYSRDVIIPFRRSFSTPPLVSLGLFYFNSCRGQKKYKYDVRVIKVWKNKFKVRYYGYRMWNVGITWMAIDRSLAPK